MTNGIPATSIIAWSAPSPSSPSSSTRRCAALWLDHSVRSKVADRGVDASVPNAPKRKSAFREILTLLLMALTRPGFAVDPIGQGADVRSVISSNLLYGIRARHASFGAKFPEPSGFRVLSTCGLVIHFYAQF